MPPGHPDSVDTRNKFEDLSGVDITAYTNPYDALIEACQNDPVIQPCFCDIPITRRRQGNTMKVAWLGPNYKR